MSTTTAVGKSRAVMPATQGMKLSMNKVYTTRDYGQFKKIKGNRPEKESHVRYLMKEIKNDGLRVPILVNSKMQVADGQHRVEACKRLRVPVQFIWIGDGVDLIDVQRLNASQKPWSNDDFCDSFIALGNKHYENYKAFIARHRFPHDTSVLLLMFGISAPPGTFKVKPTFQGGLFEVRQLEVAEETVQKVRQLEGLFPSWKQAMFLKALLNVARHKNFNWSRFITKAKAHPKMLQTCGSIDQYIDMIEHLFNYRVTPTEKVTLRYAK